MVFEAKIVQLLGNGGDIVNFIVADGTGIAKGAPLAITGDGGIASLSTGDNQPFAGIAASEKVASDGSTQLGCYTHGIFDMYCSGAAIGVGNLVMLSGAGVGTYCFPATATSVLSGAIVGKCLELAAIGEQSKILIGCGGA